MSPMEVLMFSHKFGTGDHSVTLVDFNLDQIIKRRMSMRNLSIRRGICEMKGRVFVGNKLVAEADLMAQIIKRK